jgi:hypothetical protein
MISYWSKISPLSNTIGVLLDFVKTSYEATYDWQEKHHVKMTTEVNAIYEQHRKH